MDLFSKELDMYQTFRPNRGQIVNGTVLSMTHNAVILDIGAKRDAIVPPREFTRLDEQLIDSIKVGDELPVVVTDPSNAKDQLLVSIEKGMAQKFWLQAKKHLEKGDKLDLKVIGVNKGGLLVQFGKLEGFVPNSRIKAIPRGSTPEVKQQIKESMVGSRLQLKVIEVTPSKKRLVLSPENESDNHSDETLRQLKKGDRVSGVITNLVDFGAFVDLGGIDGLIHISRLSWHKIRHPSDVVSPGEKVDCLIDSVDVERGRISLDYRALLPNPWQRFTQQNAIGSVLTGTVESIHDFGIFIGLNREITGLIRRSELTADCATLLPGDEIQVEILDLRPSQERVSLKPA